MKTGSSGCGCGVGCEVGRGGDLDHGALDLIEALDAEAPGGVEEGGEKLLGHVDLAGVGELEHGHGLLPAGVLHDEYRVLASCGLKRNKGSI